MPLKALRAVKAVPTVLRGDARLTKLGQACYGVAPPLNFETVGDVQAFFAAQPR